MSWWIRSRSMDSAREYAVVIDHHHEHEGEPGDLVVSIPKSGQWKIVAGLIVALVVAVLGLIGTLAGNDRAGIKATADSALAKAVDNERDVAVIRAQLSAIQASLLRIEGTLEKHQKKGE